MCMSEAESHLLNNKLLNLQADLKKKGGTAMIANCSTFHPHPGRVIKALFVC